MTNTNTVLKNGRKIKAKLALIGVKHADIARKCTVSSAAISRVIYGQSMSSRIRCEIAIRLGKSPMQLWPNAKTKRATQ